MNSRCDAIMLLTVHLGGTKSTDARPLSPTEWAKFAAWLSAKGLTPESLMNADLELILEGWVDNKINRLRLEKLLGRGAALGLAMEKWTRAGIWVMTRKDADYPKSLRNRLGKMSPPVLFGCGKKKLLNSNGISIVGSRNVSDEDADFTSDLGRRVANSGLSVVSGGARGVDQLAMLGALNASGTAIGILADSLLTSALSQKYRNFISGGDLVLISPFNPEAGFNVGNAMGRNKYIYCISNAAVVVCSTPEKGGTWNGAIENIAKEWVPLWIKKNTSSSSGNSLLKDRGASWFPDEISDMNVLISGSDLFEEKTKLKTINKVKLTTSRKEFPDSNNSLDLFGERVSLANINTIKPAASTKENKPAESQSESLDLYTVFLSHTASLTKHHPLKVDEIAEKLVLSKAQTNLWVKRALAENVFIKITRPVRYQYRSECSKSLNGTKT